MDISKYIEIKATKRFGKPVLVGTRICVADVLLWLANGMSSAEIVEDYPELNDEMIKACLFYAAARENHLGIAS